jgi:hypothetical protein
MAAASLVAKTKGGMPPRTNVCAMIISTISVAAAPNALLTQFGKALPVSASTTISCSTTLAFSAEVMKSTMVLLVSAWTPSLVSMESAHVLLTPNSTTVCVFATLISP